MQQNHVRFTALTTDPLNTRFGEDWARLTRHLLFNAEGNLTWKPQLWADIRKVIIPQIIDKVHIALYSRFMEFFNYYLVGLYPHSSSGILRSEP